MPRTPRGRTSSSTYLHQHRPVDRHDDAARHGDDIGRAHAHGQAHALGRAPLQGLVDRPRLVLAQPILDERRPVTPCRRRSTRRTEKRAWRSTAGTTNSSELGWSGAALAA